MGSHSISTSIGSPQIHRRWQKKIIFLTCFVLHTLHLFQCDFISLFINARMIWSVCLMYKNKICGIDRSMCVYVYRIIGSSSTSTTVATSRSANRFLNPNVCCTPTYLVYYVWFWYRHCFCCCLVGKSIYYSYYIHFVCAMLNGVAFDTVSQSFYSLRLTHSLALVLSMLVFMKRIWEYMLVCCRLAARTHSFQFHIRYWYQKPNIPIHRYFFPLLISFSQEVSIVMLWRFLYIHNVVRLLKRREFKRKNIYKKNHLSGTIKTIE